MSKILIQLGQIWSIKFPYSDDPANHKVRPAAIMGWSRSGPGEDFKILVAAITSHNDHPERARNGEISIENPMEAGLGKESFLRPRMLFSIDANLLSGQAPLGTLDKEDQIKALTIISELFQTPGTFALI